MPFEPPHFGRRLDPDPEPGVEGERALTVFTTLAGRYADGFGHIEGVSFQVEDDATDFPTVKAQVQVHELAFNLGGGVTF